MSRKAAGRGTSGIRTGDAQSVWEQLLTLPERARGSLVTQVVTGFVDAIDGNQVPEGVRLPSSRNLALQLNLGRNTVIAALNILVEQGYLSAKDRSGIYVSRRPPKAEVAEKKPLSEQFNWSAYVAQPKRLAQSMDTPPTAKFNFRYGQFDMSTFPISHWRECERKASSLNEIAEWARDAGDLDDGQLVESLRKHVLPNHGIWAARDEVLVTLGGQEGRYLVTSLLGKSGVRIGLENPGLPDLFEMVSLTNAAIVKLSLDGRGAALSSDLKQCDAVFLTPAHQCPTTAVMPYDTRVSLLEVARRRGMVVVEDTYETELLSHKSSIPALKSLDRDGRVIHIGSLSKAVAPGLRIGFVVAAPTVIRELRSIRRLIHRHPPGNVQRALAMFIDMGYYHSYLKRVSRTLSSRTQEFRRSMQEHLPNFHVDHCQGAASFWVRLPAHLSASHFVAKLDAVGIAVETGERFFTTGWEDNFLRMGVSQIKEADIDAGISRMQAQL